MNKWLLKSQLALGEALLAQWLKRPSLAGLRKLACAQDSFKSMFIYPAGNGDTTLLTTGKSEDGEKEDYNHHIV